MDVAPARRRGPAGLIVAVVLVAGTAVGCGSTTAASPPGAARSATTGESPAGAARSATTRAGTGPARPAGSDHAGPRHARARRRLTGAALGRPRVVSVGGATLTVTVVALLDPLRGARASLPPAHRAVGVRLRLSDAGATYDSTASGDVGLITAGGTASPLFVGGGPCATPLTDFESLVSAGQTRTGCVAFAVPDRARVRGVVFRPHAQATGQAIWAR